MITIFLWFLYVSVYVFYASADVPGIYGAGCTIVNNKLYVLGGVQGLQEANPNRKIYKLDLDQLNPPIWQEDSLSIPYDAVYPGVVTASASKHVLILGGKKASSNSSFYSFDFSTGYKFTVLKRPSFFEEPDKEVLKYYPYGGGFIENSATPDEYIFYGGYQLKDDLSASFANFVRRYSANNDSWTDDSVTTGPRTYFNSGNAYRDKLYVLGGKAVDGDAPQPLSSIWSYDLKKYRWEQVNSTGASVGERSHHSAVVVNNLLYVVGGINIDPIDDRVDILNLETLVWTSKAVDGLKGRSQGCLAHYNGKLIYGFGYSKNFESYPVAIDLKTWSLSKQTKTPLSVILGASIGAVVGALLIGAMTFMICRTRRKHKRFSQQQVHYEAQVRQYNGTDPARIVPTDCPDFELAEEDTDIPGLLDSTLTTPKSIGDNNTHLSNVEVPKEWSGNFNQLRDRNF